MARGQRIGATIAAAALVAAVAGCDDADDAAATTAAEYTAELEALCRATLDELNALPSPPDMITVEDFASEASSLLAAEAETARRLEPPRDDGLDDDHRAFIRNTDEQAAAWSSIEAGIADDDLADATTRIGELVLGRDELVTEMGAADCVRGGAAPQGSDS